MTMDDWNTDSRDMVEREGFHIASVSDGYLTYFAYVPDGWNHTEVAAAYASTAEYEEFPVRLDVCVDWPAGDKLPYAMDSDRSVELGIMARTGGAHWQNC